MHRQVDTSRDIADLDMNLDLLTAKERTVVRLAQKMAPSWVASTDVV